MPQLTLIRHRSYESLPKELEVGLSAQHALAGRAVVLEPAALRPEVVGLAEIDEGGLQVGDELVRRQLGIAAAAASGLRLRAVVLDVLVDRLVERHADR